MNHHKIFLSILVGAMLIGWGLRVYAAETSVLVLYKSSEKDTAEQNIFAYHLQAFAEEQGYMIVYHDIDKTLPSEEMMRNFQAITTVYNGSIMKNAKAYIHWLSEQILNKKKVIVIGNFGAFSPDGKEWYDGAVLNQFYYLLGLEFADNWTDDPKLISIKSKKTDMVEFEAKLTREHLTHYFTIKSLRPENQILLSLTRSDLEDSESAVVVKTPVGGLAMENYVFTQVKGETKKLLNLEQFFGTCLRDPIPRGAVPDRRILALYKTTEDTSSEKTLIARFLTKDLLALGYWPEYYPVDEDGIPAKKNMEAYHAILSWFRTPDMKDAEAYSDWLLTQIQDGRKVIIFGNFGAFGEKHGKEEALADNPKLNEFLMRFGLEYKGNWTGDSNLLKVTQKKSEIVEHETALKQEDLRHYYEWESRYPENIVYLAVTRTDMPESESAFIIRTPFGGFAFEGYLYKSDPKTLEISFLLNRRQFLKECLE